MKDGPHRHAADLRTVCESAANHFGAGSPILQSLDGRRLLFSEERQAVFELDEVSAHVWESLDAGISPALVVRELTDAGVADSEASALFGAAVAQLQSITAAETRARVRHRAEPPERLQSVLLEIAGVAAHLHLSDGLAADVRRLFGHLEIVSGRSDYQLCARTCGGRVDVFPAGEREWSCSIDEFAPLLKARLIEAVLRSARYEVALHAAALARGEEGALLLLGSPGAGKSTLGMALARAGFAMAADDVVLLDDSGSVSGLPLPFAAKAGSWPLIASAWPEIESAPAYRRPDGLSVRYILPETFATSRTPRRIAWLVLLNRWDREEAQVVEVDSVRALAALIAEGATRDERLSRSGFASLVAAVQGAKCFELRYSSLPEATALLRDLCS